MTPTAILKEETEKGVLWSSLFSIIFEGEYELVTSKQMVGLYHSVWIKTSLYNHLSNIVVDTVPVGTKGITGNKGAVGIRFNLYSTSFCFVNLHLTAQEGKVKNRNQNLLDIFKKMNFSSENYSLLQHDVLFVYGDLNYRIKNLSLDQILDFVQAKNVQFLIENDELTYEREKGEFGFLEEFPIKFPPTFKYQKKTNMYNLKRNPAFTDRILYKLTENMKIKTYESHTNYKSSDHKPVGLSCDILVNKEELVKIETPSSHKRRTTFVEKSNKSQWEFEDITFEKEFLFQEEIIYQKAFHTKTKQPCIVKIIERKGNFDTTKEVNNEVAFLEKLSNPFIVKLFKSFIFEKKIYLIYEMLNNNYLSLIRAKKKLSEDQARFYIANILIAIEYLHNQNIVHRDLRPENLIVDDQGFLVLTGFNYTKEITDRSFTRCGAPEYLSPEQILNNGHSKGTDYWSLGIILFESLCGYPPFIGKDINLYEKILNSPVECPKFLSTDVKDLIKKLLIKDKNYRLGCLRTGIADIKNHKWFKGIEWVKIEKKEVKPPFPPLKNDFIQIDL